MTRFWIRNLTSRNDSRPGVEPMSRPAPAPPAGGAPPGGAPVGAGTFGLPGAGAVGAPVPGRALSIRFRRDISYTPSSSPCEQRLLLLGLCRVVGGRDLRPLSDDGLRQPEDVLRNLCILVAQEERYAPVQGVDHAPPVARDRV